MEDEEGLFVYSSVVVVCAAYDILKRKRNRRRRRRWWNTKLYKQRSGTELLSDLKCQEISGQYKNFTRMSPSCFEQLLMKIGPMIKRTTTNMREPISVQDRLAVTLRFLATGDSYTSLQYLFRISKQAISKIIPEVCSAIVEVLKEYIKHPTNPSQWMEVCRIFEDEWNFPHCAGAIDGKHVVIQSPIKSGSEFFNYKSQFSIVLFALVDGDYNFLFADIGCQGRISDGGIFKDTELYRRLKNNTLGLPAPTELPGQEVKVPYFFAADSAFALSENVMKPYAGDHPRGSSKRIFNYRLSRARRVVENAFGIISSVFRVLRKPMLLKPEKAQLVVAAIVYLHNYLRRYSSHVYTPRGVLDYENEGELVPGSWRHDKEITSMFPIERRPRKSAVVFEEIRNEIATYCIKEGAVEWQKDMHNF